MYDVADYCRMAADRVRMEAYSAALQHAVTPDSIVLDMGTGIGVFAILACRYGARRVFAVEPGDVIRLAQEAARHNGVADRIEFIQDVSTRISLPERVDVMVSDLRSVLPLFEHHVPSILDARRRLLKEDGVLIPLRDTLWAAIIHAPDLYREFTHPWNDSMGVDMRVTHQVLTHRMRRIVAEPNQLITEPKCWFTLNYETVDDPNCQGSVEWIATRPSIGHGILAWFDTVLAEGIGFSNAPGETATIYGNAFFPFSSEIVLDPGDSIFVTLAADLAGDSYLWRWSTQVSREDRPNDIKASFQQMNLPTRLYSSERMRP